MEAADWVLARQPEFAGGARYSDCPRRSAELHWARHCKLGDAGEALDRASITALVNDLGDASAVTGHGSEQRAQRAATFDEWWAQHGDAAAVMGRLSSAELTSQRSGAGTMTHGSFRRRRGGLGADAARASRAPGTVLSDSPKLPALPPPVQLAACTAGGGTVERSLSVGRVLRAFESVVVQRPGDNNHVPVVAFGAQPPPPPASPPMLHTTSAGSGSATEGDDEEGQTVAVAVAAAAAAVAVNSPHPKPSPPPSALSPGQPSSKLRSLGGALANRARQRWLSISLRTATLTLFRNQSRRVVKQSVPLSSICGVRVAVGGGAKPHSFEVLVGGDAGTETPFTPAAAAAGLVVCMRITCLDSPSRTRWMTAIATHCMLHALRSVLAAPRSLLRSSTGSGGSGSGRLSQESVQTETVPDSQLLARVRAFVDAGADINLAVDDGGAGSPALLLAMLLDAQELVDAEGCGVSEYEGFAVAHYLLEEGADARCLLRGDSAELGEGKSEDQETADVGLGMVGSVSAKAGGGVAAWRVGQLLRRAGRSPVFSSDDGTRQCLLHRLVLSDDYEHMVAFLDGRSETSCEGRFASELQQQKQQRDAAQARELAKAIDAAGDTPLLLALKGAGMARAASSSGSEGAASLARGLCQGEMIALLLLRHSAMGPGEGGQQTLERRMGRDNQHVPHAVRDTGSPLLLALRSRLPAIALAMVRQATGVDDPHSSDVVAGTGGVALLDLLAVDADGRNALVWALLSAAHVREAREPMSATAAAAAASGAEMTLYLQLALLLVESEPRFATSNLSGDVDRAWHNNALALAVRCGHAATPVALSLLRHGANCNALPESVNGTVFAGWDSPFLLALKGGLSALVGSMLDSGAADLLACDNRGSRPLHLAARHGMFNAAARIAEALLAFNWGSARNTPTDFARTSATASTLFASAQPVPTLSSVGKLHVLDELDPVTGESVLNLLLAKGQVELCCALLDAGASPDAGRSAPSPVTAATDFASGATSLHFLALLAAACALRGQGDVSSADRPEVGMRGAAGTLSRVLCTAVMLLTKGAVDPLRATSPSSALILEPVVGVIGPSAFAGGLTALHVGAAFAPSCVGATAFLKVLLNCTSTSMLPELLRATDSEGHCALALAARASNADALRLLLEAGGWTGGHPTPQPALGSGTEVVAEYHSIVGLDAINCDGDAPLHLAVRAALPMSSCEVQDWEWHELQQRSVSAVAVLLQAGAHALQWDAGGLTPLHVCLALGTKHDHRQQQSGTENGMPFGDDDDDEVDALLDSVSEAISLAFVQGTCPSNRSTVGDDAGPCAATALCLNARTESGLPSAHLAAAAGRALALRTVIAAGADVRALSVGERLCLLRSGARGLRNAAAALARVRNQAELVAARGGRSDGTLLPLMSLLRGRRRALRGQLRVAKLLLVMPASSVGGCRDRRRAPTISSTPSLALDSDRLDSTPLDTAVEAVAFMHQFVGECEQQQQLLQDQWEREAVASDNGGAEATEDDFGADGRTAPDGRFEAPRPDPAAAAAVTPSGAAREAMSELSTARSPSEELRSRKLIAQGRIPQQRYGDAEERLSGSGGWGSDGDVDADEHGRWAAPNRSQLESASLRLALDEARATALEWLGKKAGKRKLANDALRLCAEQPDLDHAQALAAAQAQFIAKHVAETRADFAEEVSTFFGSESEFQRGASSGW